MPSRFNLSLLYAGFGVILLAGSSVIYDHYDKKEKQSPGRFKLQKEVSKHLIWFGLVNIPIFILAIFISSSHPKKKFLKEERKKSKTKRTLSILLFVSGIIGFWILNMVYISNMVKISSETEKNTLLSRQKQLKKIYLVFYFVTIAIGILELRHMFSG